jgi:hypothetical protein
MTRYGWLWAPLVSGCAATAAPTEKLPAELEEALHYHLKRVPMPGEGPAPGVLDIFGRAPRATMDYLIERVDSRESVLSDFQSSIGTQAARWLLEITELPFPGVEHFIPGREEKNSRAVEAWTRWWSENRDRPSRDWFAGLEWDEVLRIKRLVGLNPKDWPEVDRALVWARGRRSFAYLLRFFGRDRNSYREGDIQHFRWENANLLLAEATGQDLRPKGRRPEDREELRRLWLDWARSHRWPLE